jgi:ABC-2 type transport system permease protein
MRSNITDQLDPGAAVLRIAGAAGYIGLSLLVVAALAFLLSVSTDAPLGAVGGAVLLQILSSILNQIDALGSIRDLLPTHFSTAWIGLLSTPVQVDTMVRGAISSVIYATVFFGFAFYRFTRKDVVS